MFSLCKIQQSQQKCRAKCGNNIYEQKKQQQIITIEKPRHV